MDENQFKQIGVYFILMLSAIGLVLIEAINLLGISPMWTKFLILLWYSMDYIIAVIIYHFFKVKKQNLPWNIKNLTIGIGVGVIAIITDFGTVLIEWCSTLTLTATWMLFIGIMYYATEALIIGFIVHYFKIPEEDIPIEVPVLTPMDDTDIPKENVTE